MRTLRSKGIFAVAVGLSAILAGCGGPYPDEGSVDTTFVRKNMEIIEVSGNVYGVKTGGLDAYQVWWHDRRELGRLTRLNSTEIESGEVPQVSLKFEGSQIDVEGLRATMKRAIIDAKADVEDEIAADVAEVEAKKTKMVAELEELKAGTREYDAFISDSKQSFDAARKALNAGIDAYNAALEQPVTEINEVAKANGLKTIDSNQNPIRSYRTLDLRGRDMPASCPGQRGYETVDLRKELNECGYIRISSSLDSISGKVVDIAKASFINIEQAENQLGQKGGWNTEASGLYATLEQADERHKAAVREAKNKFGSTYKSKRKQEYLVGAIGKLDNRIEYLQSENNREKEMAYISVWAPESVEAAIDDHLSSAYSVMYDHIEKGPEVVREGKNFAFEGLGEGYEVAILLSDIIAERGDRRTNFVAVNYIDLTAPGIEEADMLKATIDRDAMAKGLRIDMTDPDEIEDAIVDMVDDAADAREERKASGNA